MQIYHRSVQLFLKNSLPPQEVSLEKHFKTINRIADVAWPEQKIIFEIQCSDISPQEIQSRINDYKTIGYSVVWILHDSRFNHYYLTPTERFLSFHSHYFTNVNLLGDGEIYDQQSLIIFGKREERSARYPINPSKPTPIQKSLTSIKERRNWETCFDGDLFHQSRTKTCHFSKFYKNILLQMIKKISH